MTYAKAIYTKNKGMPHNGNIFEHLYGVYIVSSHGICR